MPILRIQHAVPNFDGWKRAFDSDPIDRKGSGVRRYNVHRAIADPNFVRLDLEFDSAAEAERVLEKSIYGPAPVEPDAPVEREDAQWRNCSMFFESRDPP